MSPNRDCDHGQLARQCEICELIEDRDKLKVELAAALERERELQTVICLLMARYDKNGKTTAEYAEGLNYRRSASKACENCHKNGCEGDHVLCYRKDGE